MLPDEPLRALGRRTAPRSWPSRRGRWPKMGTRLLRRRLGELSV